VRARSVGKILFCFMSTFQVQLFRLRNASSDWELVDSQADVFLDQSESVLVCIARAPSRTARLLLSSPLSLTTHRLESSLFYVWRTQKITFGLLFRSRPACDAFVQMMCVHHNLSRPWLLKGKTNSGEEDLQRLVGSSFSAAPSLGQCNFAADGIDCSRSRFSIYRCFSGGHHYLS
jgi:hypothetical protein